MSVSISTPVSVANHNQISTHPIKISYMIPVLIKRNQTPESNHCYRYDEQGHYSKDCPIIFQMAEMDIHDFSLSETDLSLIKEVSESKNN